MGSLVRGNYFKMTTVQGKGVQFTQQSVPAPEKVSPMMTMTFGGDW